MRSVEAWYLKKCQYDYICEALEISASFSYKICFLTPAN